MKAAKIIRSMGMNFAHAEHCKIDFVRLRVELKRGCRESTLDIRSITARKEICIENDRFSLLWAEHDRMVNIVRRKLNSK